MNPFGCAIEKHLHQQQRSFRSWMRMIRGLAVGWGDLHSLTRCPPVGRRLNGAARLVADLGCGQGRFHLEVTLRTRFAGTVVGVDTDLRALAAAKSLAERCGCRAAYVCASAQSLPFREGCFEQVFMMDVIEHITDDGAALVEARRVLRVGGSLEISAPTPLYPTVFGRRFHNEIGHVRDGYPLSGLAERLGAAGLVVTTARQNSGWASWLIMAPWYRFGIRHAQHRGLKLMGRLLLVLLGLILRQVQFLDRFGGYCTNDVEARRLAS